MRGSEVLIEAAALEPDGIVGRRAARRLVGGVARLRTRQRTLPRLDFTPRLIRHTARHVVGHAVDKARGKGEGEGCMHRVHLHRILAANCHNQTRALGAYERVGVRGGG